MWETWQRGLFFKVWLYQCVFSVHSCHSFWKPSEQRELTSYISVNMERGGRRLAVVCLCVCDKRASLIAVVVVFVVAAEGREASQTDSI